MIKLDDGMELSSICFSNDSVYLVGSCGVAKITITMQNGWGSPMPWAQLDHDDGRATRLVNLAQAESITMKEGKSDD